MIVFVEVQMNSLVAVAQFGEYNGYFESIWSRFVCNQGESVCWRRSTEKVS